MEERIQPYMYEPYASSSSEEDEQIDTEDDALNAQKQRIGNTDWCLCGKCISMVTMEECMCCHEVGPIVEKRGKDSPVTGDLECICQHPGFQVNCLDVWALQMAFENMPKKYKKKDGTVNEKYRHTGYRNFTKWIWGYLGKKNRVVLPACVVGKLRETFSSEQYVGFKYPKL